MPIKQHVWYQTPALPAPRLPSRVGGYGGWLVSQVASSLQRERVGGRRETLLELTLNLENVGPNSKQQSLGCSRTGMRLEQEASQHECKVSAQGFVWPQKNNPLLPTLAATGMYAPLQTMQICHALMVLMMIGIPWWGEGGDIYASLPSATLTGSPVPPHDHLHSLSFTLTTGGGDSSPFEGCLKAGEGQDSHLRGEQLWQVPEIVGG